MFITSSRQRLALQTRMEVFALQLVGTDQEPRLLTYTFVCALPNHGSLKPTAVRTFQISDNGPIRLTQRGSQHLWRQPHRKRDLIVLSYFHLVKELWA